MAKERIFGRLKRPLYRKDIPRLENAIGFVLLLSLAGAGVWVLRQKNNYDPSTRDLPLADLKASAIQNIYKKPLQPWEESAQGPTQQDLGHFQASILHGWNVNRGLKRYTPENLFEKVDGQSEQYLTFGFTGLESLTLQNALGQSADILLFQQGDFSQSLGLYAEQRSPEHVVLHLGSLHYTLTSVGAFGIMGPYFFQIILTGNPEQIASASQHFLKALGQTPLGAETSQLAFQQLLDAGASFSDISYVPENVFQYGFASDFWFAKVSPQSSTTRFSHRAKKPDEASALLEQFKKVLPEDYKLVLEQAGIYFYQHLHLKTFFVMKVEGEVLSGLDEVSNLDMAKQLILPQSIQQTTPNAESHEPASKE